MTNPTHESELMLGVKSWNQWIQEQRKTSPGFRANLSGIDLRRSKIQGKAIWIPNRLVGCYIDQNRPQGAHLPEAQLQNAVLNGSQMEGAVLIKAQLQGAMLNGVNLQGAVLDEADFEGAELSFAKLQKAAFNRANLKKAQMDRTVMEGAFLLNTKLEEANLKYSILNQALLRGADLTRADLAGAQLQEADLSGAQLHGANLTVQIEGTDFKKDTFVIPEDPNKVPIIRARLRTQLQSAKLDNVAIDGADFSEANLDGAELKIATLDEKTRFKDTLFHNCVISIDGGVNQNTAIQVLAQGVVNNAQFIDPVFGRKVRDQAWLNKWLENIEHLKTRSRRKYWGTKAWAWLWRITSDYGRNPWPWIRLSCGLVLFFALIFYLLGNKNYYLGDQIQPLPDGFWTYLYYSVVTFTTLGFGDITAKTHIGMFWAALEVILGYVMLGGLISIFASKFARRND